MQSALPCLVCMCENTLLYLWSLLVSHICGGKKGCEIWSTFQEKQLAPFTSRQCKAGPLPRFLDTFVPVCRARPTLQEEEGEGAGGSSSPKGRATAQQGGHRVGHRRGDVPTRHSVGLRAEPSRRATQRAARSSLELLPCRAGCAGILKEAGLGVHGSLFYLFMIGAACKEKLSFFPRACRTSFAGPARCRAKVYRERGHDASACWCSRFAGRVWMGSSEAVCTVLAICRNIYFSQRAVTVWCCRVMGRLLSTVSKGGYGAVSQAQLPKGRLISLLFFFFPFTLSYLGLLMPLLLQQISQGGMDNFPDFYCPVTFSVVVFIFFS